MYALTPLKVYAMEAVRDDPACMARMERMLGAVGWKAEEVAWVAEETLPSVMGELLSLWPPQTVPDGCVRSYMRPWVFTKMDLSANRPSVRPVLARCPDGTPERLLRRICGQFITVVDQHPYEVDQPRNLVCWPTLNLGTIEGCPHGCQYCGGGRDSKALVITLNLEEYMEQVVGPVIEANPWSKVLRMILDNTELVAFEPEYGLFDLFSRKLAEYDGRWGHFHTAGAYADWLEEIPHRDRLIGVWSTSADEVVRDFEPGAGPAVDRYHAARKCQDLGVPVRFKYKPVIPIRGWREAYRATIEQALQIVRPESIGFCLYAWNSYAHMMETLPTDLLDPECLDAARRTADEMKDRRCGPFPHETRREIYRFFIREIRRWDKDVLLYVSTETREMWDELQEELGQDPRCYVCGCSSVAVPGRKLAVSPGFRYSTYNPAPV